MTTTQKLEDFPVGAQVKLTGSGWTDRLHAATAGDIVEVTGHKGNQVTWKSANGQTFYIYLRGADTDYAVERWGGELVVDEVTVEWVEQDDWSKVGLGDKVRLTHGESVGVGKVSYHDDGNIEVKIGESTVLDTHKSDGWKLEVVKPEEKLEPGLYRYGTGIVVVHKDGTASYNNLPNAIWAHGSSWIEIKPQPSELHQFTRLNAESK